jgi:hypothetical protein
VPTTSHFIPASISSDFQPLALTTANDSSISIISKGQRILAPNIILSDTIITPSIPQGIVSPQLLMQENDYSILFHHQSVYLLRNSNYNSIVYYIINDKNSILSANLDPSDNLYKITNSTELPTVSL